MSTLPSPAPRLVEDDRDVPQLALTVDLPSRVHREPLTPAEPTKARRGRPPGQKMRIAAQQLKHHHFSFLRSLTQGIELDKAWDRYLAFEGGPDDRRHQGARARELISLVRLGAEERGLQARADVALAGLIDRLPKPAPRYPARPDVPADSPTAGPALPATPPQPGAPAIPSLNDWITSICDATGEDPEDTRISEWQERYNDEFGLDLAAAALPATALEEPAPSPALVPTAAPIPPAPPLPSVDARVDALNVLTNAMATAPALTDGLSVWLSPELASRLANTRVNGKPLPLIKLADLIGMVNVFHHRWWTHVPRLGADRASRLVAWLAPLAEQLGKPINEISRKPLQQLQRERASQLAVLDARGGERHTVFAVVPLDRLAVPPELSGRQGVFRAHDRPNVFNVDNDLAAIFEWLKRHKGSPRTIASYQLIIERFYLWSVWFKRKPLSSLSEDDFREYRAFMAKPPADWIQSRRAGRGTSEWRPFKKAADPSSIKLNFVVLASLISGLHDGGYLSANAITGAMPAVRRDVVSMNIDRSFNDAQWHWIMTCWESMYRECGPLPAEGVHTPLFPDVNHPDQQFLRAAGLRRTKLLLELGATTGLRLLEFVTTRRGAIFRATVDGQDVWMVTVLGKGDKMREVPLYDDVKALIDQHHADMQKANTHFDPTSRGERTLKNPTARPTAQEGQQDPIGLDAALPSSLHGTGEAKPVFDPRKLPLIGALRRATRPKVLSDLGLPEADATAPLNTDSHGSLDPTALYQSLKRFLAECSRRAASADAGVDPQTLLDASTHWLRHFFANSAVTDEVNVVALKDALGHASLATTSIYLRTERKRMVSELGKRQRRT